MASRTHKIQAYEINRQSLLSKEETNVNENLLEEVGLDFEEAQSKSNHLNLATTLNTASIKMSSTIDQNNSTNGESWRVTTDAGKTSSQSTDWQTDYNDESTVDNEKSLCEMEYFDEMPLDHEPANSDIVFNVDDSELDEMDKVQSDTAGNDTDSQSDVIVLSSASNKNEPTDAKTSLPPPATKLGNTGKKSKRKFGLQYILVSLADSTVGPTPQTMKESPHECVLCLAGQTFNATMLAKHVNSAAHLACVLELHDWNLYQKHKKCEDAEQLLSILHEVIPVPTETVKLMVVTEDKVETTREKMVNIIAEEKLKVKDAPTHLERQPNGDRRKRSLNSHHVSDSSSKRNKTFGSNPDKETKFGLIVGDERAKIFHGAYPDLAESCNLAWYPTGSLEKILSGALMRINSTTKVLIIVSLLNDFVVERPEMKSLYILSPNVEHVTTNLRKFARNVYQINQSVKIIMTVPAYVDFIAYSKRLKRLQPADFTRLESYTKQIVESFDKLCHIIKGLHKNTEMYSFNITLRDHNKHGLVRGKPHNAEDRMQFFNGTLADGFHLSDAANRRIAQGINIRTNVNAARIPNTRRPDAPKRLIESWADCKNIVIVGDHETFKFDSAPLDMVKNVSLVTKKFATMQTLLEKADTRLDSTVDLLIVVGLYREFAQNVVNGRFTLLEPKMPDKDEVFTLLQSYKNKWMNMYPRLVVFFTIPHVVDFFKYNTKNNPDLQVTQSFTNEMNSYSHQFSRNVMSFYKDIRPALTLNSKRIWLYHITNSMYEHHPTLLSSLGNFDVSPQFPPNSSFDGFKPNQKFSAIMRAELIFYVTKTLSRTPIPIYSDA